MTTWRNDGLRWYRGVWNDHRTRFWHIGQSTDVGRENERRRSSEINYTTFPAQFCSSIAKPHMNTSLVYTHEIGHLSTFRHTRIRWPFEFYWNESNERWEKNGSVRWPFSRVAICCGENVKRNRGFTWREGAVQSSWHVVLFSLWVSSWSLAVNRWGESQVNDRYQPSLDSSGYCETGCSVVGEITECWELSTWSLAVDGWGESQVKERYQLSSVSSQHCEADCSVVGEITECWELSSWSLVVDGWGESQVNERYQLSSDSSGHREADCSVVGEVVGCREVTCTSVGKRGNWFLIIRLTVQS